MCNSKRSDQERQHLLRDMRTLVSKKFNAWLKMMILRFNFDITYVVIVIVDFASKEDLVLDDSLVVRRLESIYYYCGNCLKIFVYPICIFEFIFGINSLQ